MNMRSDGIDQTTRFNEHATPVAARMKTNNNDEKNLQIYMFTYNLAMLLQSEKGKESNEIKYHRVNKMNENEKKRKK